MSDDKIAQRRNELRDRSGTGLPRVGEKRPLTAPEENPINPRSDADAKDATVQGTDAIPDPVDAYAIIDEGLDEERGDETRV